MQVQVNARRVDFGQKADQVLQRSAKAIDRPRQHNVELAPHSVLAQRVEPGSLVPALGAADTAISVNLDDGTALALGNRTKFVLLVGARLPVCRDAGVDGDAAVALDHHGLPPFRWPECSISLY